MTRAVTRIVMCGAVVCLTAAVAFAQTTTTTQQTKKFQIIAVDGNTLVVKLPEGTRELTVADDFRFNVDGKQLAVRELKAGMSGTANITTTTTVTPVTVTEVKNGTVVKALGTSIIVALGEGGYKMFSQSDIDKRGIKIMRDGKVASISDLRENDRLTATIITSLPPTTMTEQQVTATLAKASPGAGAGTAGAGTAKPAASTAKPAGTTAKPAASTAPAAGAPASPSSTGAAPRTLPKTGSFLPLLGMTGVASLVAGFGLTVRRRRASR